MLFRSADSLKEYLGRTNEIVLLPNEKEVLQENLFYRNVEYILWIPESFAQTCIAEGEPLKVVKLPGSSSGYYIDRQINSFLQYAQIYEAADFTEAEAAEKMRDITSAEITLLDTKKNVGKTPDYTFYYQYMPYLVMSVISVSYTHLGSNMSDADIDKAVKEAAEFEAQDKKRKEAIDTRNEADTMVFQTEKALKEVGDKLDANDKAAVEADCQALKDVLAKSTPEEATEAQIAEIKAAKEKLMESAQKLFTKMYEQAGAAAGAGAAGGPAPEAGPAPDGFQGCLLYTSSSRHTGLYFDFSW